AELRGIPLYDPREDSEAGGEGDQRWDDPSTWGFSDNPIVIAYNLLRGIHYQQVTDTALGPLVWGGGASEAQLPFEPWAAAMDAADAAGFRAGRRISVSETPNDVITEFLAAANARIAYCAG